VVDLGGVVIRTPFEMLHKLDPFPNWTGPFAPERDQLWQTLQGGEITEREYWQARAGEYFDGDDPLRDLFRAVLDHPEEEAIRPEMAALLRSVDQPGAITNDLARFHSQEWIDGLSILRVFDPLIDLSHEKYLKPDPRAFELALLQLALPAAEVLFVDDQPHNLEGAAAVGIPTVWFDVTDPAGSITTVKAALDA